MLFRNPRSGASEEYARALWLLDLDEGPEGLVTWTLDEQRELAQTLRELDQRLVDCHEDDQHECITLSTDTHPGVDYEVMSSSILVEVDAMGVDSAHEAQLLAQTLDVLDRIAHRTGLLVWSVELGRIVDPKRDAEAIRSLAVAAAPNSSPRQTRMVIMFAIVLAILLSSWILGGG